MYTLPKGTKITNTILNDVIAYNEKYKKRFETLENYYIGKHDIVSRKKDDRLKNNKVMINHAKYITDTNVGYLLGNPVDYQVSEGYEIEPILDAYKKQTINDLDSEIAKDISKEQHISTGNITNTVDEIENKSEELVKYSNDI